MILKHSDIVFLHIHSSMLQVQIPSLGTVHSICAQIRVATAGGMVTKPSQGLVARKQSQPNAVQYAFMSGKFPSDTSWGIGASKTCSGLVESIRRSTSERPRLLGGTWSCQVWNFSLAKI